MSARPESIREHLQPHELAQYDALWRRLLAPVPDPADTPEPEPEDEDGEDIAA